MMNKKIVLAVLLAFSLLGNVHAAKNVVGAIPGVKSLLHKQFQQDDFAKVDDEIVAAAWAAEYDVLDDYKFPYSVDELEANWGTLTRGLKVPYPSASYLKTLYLRYPALYSDLANQEADWDELSQNTLEVWWLFFKGDFKAAMEKGHAYGGYARGPAMFAEIVHGTYYTKKSSQKTHLLQKAANDAGRLAQLMDYKKNVKEYPEDFLHLRLVYVYATGRGIEDQSIPKLLRSSAPFKVIDAANAIIDHDPEHPMGLSLQGSIDSNVIRRMGKVGGKLASFSDSEKAKENYELALKAVGDMAMLRLEYANTVLYVDKEKGLDQAILNLWIASNTKSASAMEELDRVFSAKRLKEIKAIKEADVPFKKFDKARTKYIRKNDVNIYYIGEPAFIYEAK